MQCEGSSQMKSASTKGRRLSSPTTYSSTVAGKVPLAGKPNLLLDAVGRAYWFPERYVRYRQPNTATGCHANGCNARTIECRDRVHPARHYACRRSGE